jgi:hypothetical protein
VKHYLATLVNLGLMSSSIVMASVESPEQPRSAQLVRQDKACLQWINHQLNLGRSLEMIMHEEKSNISFECLSFFNRVVELADVAERPIPNM